MKAKTEKKKHWKWVILCQITQWFSQDPRFQFCVVQFAKGKEQISKSNTKRSQDTKIWNWNQGTELLNFYNTWQFIVFFSKLCSLIMCAPFYPGCILLFISWFKTLSISLLIFLPIYFTIFFCYTLYPQKYTSPLWYCTLSIALINAIWNHFHFITIVLIKWSCHLLFNCYKLIGKSAN